MNLTPEEKRQIWDEIIKFTQTTQRQPGDYTVQEFMKETGLTRNQARDRLQRLVDAGVLERIQHPFSNTVLYRPIAPFDPKDVFGG
jgi:Fic family protein